MSTHKAQNKLSERKYLELQAYDAKAALTHTLEKLRADALRGVDPRAWAGAHPWVMVASATAAGFMGGYLFTPSKENQALAKLAKIEKALRGGEHSPSPADGKTAKKPKGWGGFFAGQALRLLKPIVLSSLSAAVTAKATDASGEADSTETVTPGEGI